MQVLQHPWIAGSQAAENQLNGVLQQMRLSQDTANQIIKRGYLTKQGKIVRNWKKRSFVLTEKALQYFEDELAREPKGTISVADIDKVGHTRAYLHPVSDVCMSGGSRGAVVAATARAPCR